LFRLILGDHIKKCGEKTRTQIEWLLKLEARPATLNEHYYSDYKARWVAHFKGWRNNDKNKPLMGAIDSHNSSPSVRLGQPSADAITQVLSALAGIGMSGMKAEDLSKLLPPDPMEKALVIMAEVRAYFQGTF
jgi:hypothetical protein